jgi:hypothetical protein
LVGFLEGDVTFSTNKFRPRVKFECQSGEKRLFDKIQDYLGVGKVFILKEIEKAEFIKV